jgi:16S rRNA (cytosine1402-N4)-methyltransferase
VGKRRQPRGARGFTGDARPASLAALDSDSINTPEWGGHGAGGHVPVLLKEAIDFLAVKQGGTYLDATVGLGGHSYEIAKRLGAAGHLIGFDKDPAALERAQMRLAPVDGRSSLVVREGETQRTVNSDQRPDWPTITLLHRSFAELANDQRPATIDGIIADLGVSSLQLGDPERGFSFQAEGPLDMRMNPMSGETAEQVVNHIDERELADVIYEFGEERRSRRIARAIVRSRPISTTKQLVAVISAAARPMKQKHERLRIHPATRTFQALRIFVNRELDDLKALLVAAPRVLKPGGRLVVISFHSLEDRIVKDALREGAKQGWYELLTKKPLTASEEEIDRNPRSRSAKMRAAEKV